MPFCNSPPPTQQNRPSSRYSSSLRLSPPLPRHRRAASPSPCAIPALAPSSLCHPRRKTSTARTVLWTVRRTSTDLRRTSTRRMRFSTSVSMYSCRHAWWSQRRPHQPRLSRPRHFQHRRHHHRLRLLCQRHLNSLHKRLPLKDRERPLLTHMTRSS